MGKGVQVLQLGVKKHVGFVPFSEIGVAPGAAEARASPQLGAERRKGTSPPCNRPHRVRLDLPGRSEPR